MKTASALLKSEARLLARNPGVVIWTVVLPVTASIVLAAIPAIRRPDDSLGGLSFFQVYQQHRLCSSILCHRRCGRCTRCRGDAGLR